MTQDELRALGERWKACLGFRWRPGMVDEEGYRVLAVHRDRYLTVAKADEEHVDVACPAEQMGVPDVSCPATRGWLLEDVREAWGDPWATPVPYHDDGDEVWGLTITSGPEFYEASEAEVLIAAMEAVPKNRRTQ